MKHRYYKHLLSLIIICTIFVFSTSCNINQSENKHIHKGTYYLNKRISGDTLFFQNNKPNRLESWFMDEWRITEDSIFQQDSRGLSFFIGNDKCQYSMKGDTLVVNFKRKKRGEYDKRIGPAVTRKYLVLKSNKKKLELIHLGEDESPVKFKKEEIRLK